MIGVLLFLGAPLLGFSLFLCRELYRRKIFGSGEDGRNEKLSRSPSLMSVSNMVALVFFLLLKYVPRPFGYRTGLVMNRKGDGFDLPPITLSAPLFITPESISTFSNSLNAPSGTSKSMGSDILNPFLLTSLTTPLLLILLSHPSNPIKPLGAVNTRNRFVSTFLKRKTYPKPVANDSYKTFHYPFFLRNLAALLTASRKGALSVRADFGGANRDGVRRKRGVEFDVVITVIMNKKPLLTQELSFLQFLPKSAKPAFVEVDPSVGADKSAVQSGSPPGDPISYFLDLDTAAPRRWAASCKDYNPIHVSALAARLFGFPSVIAHGNHVVALAVQELQRKREGKAYEMLWEVEKATTFEVWFRKPLVLPCKADVNWEEMDGEGATLVVAKGGKVCVEGKIEYDS